MVNGGGGGGRGDRNRIREELGEGRRGGGDGETGSESGIGIVRGINWILEREKRVGEIG